MNARLFILTGFAIFLQGTGLQSQSLETLIETGEANNPELQAYRLRYNLAAEKSSEAAALPDTELGAGIFVSEPETRTGAQKARFSIRQMLPWFGQITAREAYATSLAEVDYLNWVIARRKLRLDIARGYYALQSLRQQMEILRAQDRLLDSYREIALTAVETGRASAVDVLRLDIRQNDLRAKKEVLENDYQAREFSFYKLLNVPGGELDLTLAIIPDSLPAVPLPELGPHPELEKYDRLFESVSREEELNRKQSGPGLGLGLDYIPVAERTDVVLPDNGKDILMPMVSLSVPLFNTRYRSRTRQNQIRQEAIRAEETTRQNQLESLLEQTWQRLQSQRIRFLTKTDNTRRTRQAIEILLRQYQTQTVDFTDLLEMQDIELGLLLDRTEALEAYLSERAMLNYLTAAEANLTEE